MSIIKMRGPIDVLFAFKIFSLPVPTRPGTRTFWQVPDPSRPEVKNPYPSDPAYKYPLLFKQQTLLDNFSDSNHLTIPITNEICLRYFQNTA